jgi:putative endonuclease
MERHPAVYILASQPNGTLYIGTTSHLIKRIGQHKNNQVEGFTQKYQVHRLVYFERHATMLAAIRREKQLKKWMRAWKIALIEKTNPAWRDLWEDIRQLVHSGGIVWIPAFAGMTMKAKAAGMGSSLGRGRGGAKMCWAAGTGKTSSWPVAPR